MTSPDTLARVERACAELVRDAEPVTFTNVPTGPGSAGRLSTETRTSEWSSKNTPSSQPRPASLSGGGGRGRPLWTAVEALAERVRSHEEQLRRLSGPQAERTRFLLPRVHRRVGLISRLMPG